MSKHKDDFRPFRFKQFSLSHHRSSMKVGTDANLLAIWADLVEVKRALDVGTGCGIIALLVASRSEAVVDAIEMEPDSAQEAAQNFKESPFSSRLHLIQDDFIHYASQQPPAYDLVVSNPPFFINDFRPEDQKWRNARHGDRLNYHQLCRSTASLLKPDGRFCLVLPYLESKTFLKIAAESALFLNRQMVIFPKRGALPNRVNMEFRFRQTQHPVTEKFIIREEHNTYTQQFIHFMKDYYIGLD